MSSRRKRQTEIRSAIREIERPAREWRKQHDRLDRALKPPRLIEDAIAERHSMVMDLDALGDELSALLGEASAGDPPELVDVPTATSDAMEDLESWGRLPEPDRKQAEDLVRKHFEIYNDQVSALRRFAQKYAKELEGFEMNSIRRNPRGIYHEVGLGKGDFVIHQHRGNFYVDRVDAGGMHQTIGSTRGEPSLESAIHRAREEAHLKSLGDHNIYAQVGDELKLLVSVEKRPRVDKSTIHEDLARTEQEMRGMSANRAHKLPPPPVRRLRRPGRLPAVPSRQGPASVLSSVRDQEEWDPARSYPRETKPHHFAVNSRNKFESGSGPYTVYFEDNDTFFHLRKRTLSAAKIEALQQAKMRGVVAVVLHKGVEKFVAQPAELHRNAAAYKESVLRMVDVLESLREGDRVKLMAEGLRRPRVLTVQSVNHHERGVEAYVSSRKVRPGHVSGGRIEYGQVYGHRVMYQPTIQQQIVEVTELEKVSGMRRNSDSDSEVRSEVAEGAARMFFVSPWADAAEEAGENFSGMQIEDVAPETPEEVVTYAETFIEALERLNGKSIDIIYKEHRDAHGRHLDDRLNPNDFGSDLALMAMGTGVSWYDDHPVPRSGELRVPDAQLYIYVDPDDLENVTVENFEIDERFA